MKICSLLPSATEILFVLGMGDQVVGVSHECDFPAAASSKRVLIQSRLGGVEDPGEIDRQVREFLRRGESLYRVDAQALAELEPDLLVTQDLCHVCAITPDDLASALAGLRRAPNVITLNPHSLADVRTDIRRLGVACDRVAQAAEIAAAFEIEIAQTEAAVAGARRRRVLCLEWLDPLYVAGHWVPEMVERAGGTDVLGIAGQPSFTVTWQAVLDSRPEVIIVMPCGYRLEQALREFRTLSLPGAWQDLPAVKDNCIFAVDASGYFSRPGPRLAPGVAILANILHGTHANGDHHSNTAPWVRVAGT
jgi:iron complex transport system substrate-binding protein